MARADLNEWAYRQLKKGRDVFEVKKEIESKGGLDDYSYERDQAINYAIDHMKKDDPNFAYWHDLQKYQDIYLVAALVLAITIYALYAL